jgi:hypothetical protein
MKNNIIATNLSREEIKEKFEEMGYDPTVKEIEEATITGEIALYMEGYQDADFYDIVKSKGLTNNDYDGKFDILNY